MTAENGGSLRHRLSNGQLSYHFHPQTGWLNDPNGLSFFNGKYQLFYQHEPTHEYPWKAPMCWGHAETEDFLHFRELPPALTPDQPYDIRGCWSGTATEIGGRLYAFYASIDQEWNQTISVAWSEDGVNFTKYEGNPVIHDIPRDGSFDFRDPAILVTEQGYYLVIASADTVKKTGNLLLYRSEDLLHWDYEGVLYEVPGARCCECPSLVQTAEGVYLALSVALPSGDHYFEVMLGDFDGRTYRPRITSRFQKGPDEYAGQLFPAKDGRCLLISWIPGWSYQPDQCIGALSLPLEIFPKKTEKGDILCAYPAREVQHLVEDGSVTDAYLKETYRNGGEEVEIRLLKTGHPTLLQRRYSPYWTRPDWNEDERILPYDAQAYLTEKGDGTYRAAFLSPEAGPSEPAGSREFAAEAENPYQALQEAAGLAADHFQIPLRNGRSYPELFEYPGWCSWDSMEIWVDEEGLLEKCREFKDKQIPIRWAILDDMWADIEWTRELPKFTPHEISFEVMHASKMRHFHADPKRFPDGLEGTIRRMKELLPGLQVGIWHPVTGYWAGLTEDGDAYRLLKPYTVKLSDGRILPDFREEEKAYGFFSTLHRYFRECGASFVKVDNQSFAGVSYQEICDPLTAARNMHRALERSVKENFDGVMINCMGMATENLLSRPYSCVSRTSDDFQPENSEWFAKHLKQCAYNSLFQGQFYVCDWDMWWTDDSQAAKNSLLRAVSGGPVYVSDRIGRTRREILQPLMDENGRLRRMEGPCLPTRDCLFRDPVTSGRAMAVFNRRGRTVYVAAFNLDGENKEVQGCLNPAEFGLTGKTVIEERSLGETKRTVEHGLVSGGTLPYTLKNRNDYRLFVIRPEGESREIFYE